MVRGQTDAFVVDDTLQNSLPDFKIRSCKRQQCLILKYITNNHSKFYKALEKYAICLKINEETKRMLIICNFYRSVISEKSLNPLNLLL